MKMAKRITILLQLVNHNAIRFKNNRFGRQRPHAKPSKLFSINGTDKGINRPSIAQNPKKKKNKCLQLEADWINWSY